MRRCVLWPGEIDFDDDYDDESFTFEMGELDLGDDEDLDDEDLLDMAMTM